MHSGLHANNPGGCTHNTVVRRTPPPSDRARQPHAHNNVGEGIEANRDNGLNTKVDHLRTLNDNNSGRCHAHNSGNVQRA